MEQEKPKWLLGRLCFGFSGWGNGLADPCAELKGESERALGRGDIVRILVEGEGLVMGEMVALSVLGWSVAQVYMSLVEPVEIGES